MTPLRLVEDRRTSESINRRRGDCWLLEECELEWIRQRGGAQARCPDGCADYGKKKTRIFP